MNRLPHVSRLPGLVACIALWLALAAVAQAETQAQTKTHRHARRPLKARIAPKRVTRKRRAGTRAKNPTAVSLAALAARDTRGGHKLVAHARLHRAAVRAHIAGDPAVSIVDFNFSPGTITIHVGDTITWTNSGKQPHSATADNHSFDTGILRTGQSASHTFSAAGTYTYICIVHPFMKGKVVVLASTTSSNNNSNTSTHTTTTPTTNGTTTGTTTTPTSGGQTLPFTGTNDLAAFAIGLLLVGGGLGLRARSRASTEE
jgi:plastocyanin